MPEVSSSKTKLVMVIAIIAIVIALVLVVKYANTQTESGVLAYENPVLAAVQVDVDTATEAEEGEIEIEPAYSIEQTTYRDDLVTIDEYSDFECPACQSMAPVLKELLHTYPGQVQLRYHDNPLTSIHPLAYEGALAGECAARQQRFAPMHDQLFDGQSDWAKRSYEPQQGPLETVFVEYAQAINLNVEEFTSCVTSSDAEAAVEEDMRDASRQNINSTPTIFVNGERFVGQRYDELREMVRQAVEATQEVIQEEATQEEATQESSLESQVDSSVQTDTNTQVESVE